MESNKLSILTIPNLITICSLISGTLATLFSQRNFILSAIFILISALFDAMDGFIARKIKSSSLIGKELDSLADMVSFGVAPALLIVNVSSENFILSLLVALEYISIGALRLAKFNLTGRKEFFEGTPIPSQAVFVISSLLIFKDVISIVLIAIFSPLMLASFRYPNFKTKIGARVMVYLLIISTVLWIIIIHLLMVEDLIILTSTYAFVTIISYFIIGPILFKLKCNLFQGEGGSL